jgi:hypothetical protein
MGNCNSGRRRSRNRGMMEDVIRLDIRVMRRQGLFVAGLTTHGDQRWNWKGTGESAGAVSVAVDLEDHDAPHVVLRFSLDGAAQMQVIRLASRQMPYGGRRYYFLCPKLGRRCEVLPMIGGVFASRQAHRLTYRTQSIAPVDRLRARAQKLESRLWPGKGKPGRVRGRNRERLLAVWGRAELALDTMFDTMIAGLWDRAAMLKS